MLKFRTTGFVPLLAVVALTFTASAQTPPPLLQIIQVEVKPDRLPEWREITKRFSEAHKKAGGAFRHVWRNRIGNPYEYAIVFPRENYAEYDHRDPRGGGCHRLADPRGGLRSGDVLAIGEAELAALFARRRQCTADSVRVTIRRPIPELAIVCAGGQPPKMRESRTVVEVCLRSVQPKLYHVARSTVLADGWATRNWASIIEPGRRWLRRTSGRKIPAYGFIGSSSIRRLQKDVS